MPIDNKSAQSPALCGYAARALSAALGFLATMVKRERAAGSGRRARLPRPPNAPSSTVFGLRPGLEFELITGALLRGLLENHGDCRSPWIALSVSTHAANHLGRINHACSRPPVVQGGATTVGVRILPSDDLRRP